MRTLTRTAKRTYSTAPSSSKHLLSLADVSVPEISNLLGSAAAYKAFHKKGSSIGLSQKDAPLPLAMKTLALMFSKRSTRTRVASESAAVLLGAHPMFLGASDIQLGVNESLYDTARIVGSMTDGIMARVGHHSEVEVSSSPLNLLLRVLKRNRHWQNIQANQSSTPFRTCIIQRKSSLIY